jgi:hypothetical protein
MGIEPTSEAWEASILPLYDARSRISMDYTQLAVFPASVSSSVARSFATLLTADVHAYPRISCQRLSTSNETHRNADCC